MTFKDTKEGETHSYNDGCGDLEHNDPLLIKVLKMPVTYQRLQNKMYDAGLRDMRDKVIKLIREQ